MMERVWDRDTILPGETRAAHEPLSKGQCAVTSYYLAQELEKKNYQILFCKGDVYFENSDPIINHRWLRVVDDPRIIDITDDQNGADCPVIYDDADTLRARGIVHEALWERPLHAIADKADLFARVKILRQKLQP